MSGEAENPDQPQRTVIRLRIPCGCGCGEIAVMELSPENARRTATGLLAAADGMARTEDIDVRGEG